MPRYLFHICDDGARAEKLKNNATTITSTSSDQVTVGTEMPTFAPSEKNDYTTTESIFTVCRLLEYVTQAEAVDSGLGASEHGTVFQINHARILEPKANENFYTNAGD